MPAIDLITMNRQLTDKPLYVYNDNGDRFDISSQPILDPPDLLETVGSELVDRRNNHIFGRYMYNGVRVPRVTSVLEYCSGETEYLNRWAAKLGDKYTEEKFRILNAGSKIHELIEDYLSKGTTFGAKNIASSIKREVLTSFNNFLSWYNKVTITLGWEVELFVSEVPLICPWFGGTADAILIINGKRYLVDFKSSKKLTPEYFIQVSVYTWIIDNFRPDLGPIDGVGLLRFDKYKSNCYEDIFLERDNPYDAQYINHCQQVFSVALNMFYSMNVLLKETSMMKKEKAKVKKEKKIS